MMHAKIPCPNKGGHMAAEKKWTEYGAFYVTRLNGNATNEVVSQIRADIHDFLAGGTILDQLVKQKTDQGPRKARLVNYKDPLTGKVFRFLSNLFDFQSHTIVLLYKDRWEIEPFFKRIKQKTWLFFLGQPGKDQNTGMDGIDCQSNIHHGSQSEQRSGPIHHLSVHGQSQPDLLCLLTDHPKNQFPRSRRTKSGNNNTIGYL